MTHIKHILITTLLAVMPLSGCFGSGEESLSIRGEYPVSQSTSHVDGIEKYNEAYKKLMRLHKEADAIFRSKQPVDAARFVEARETLKALHAETAALSLSQCLNASRVSMLRAVNYLDKRIGFYQSNADVSKEQRSNDANMLLFFDDPASYGIFFCTELEKNGYKALPPAIGDSSVDAISNYPIDDSNAPITGMHKVKSMMSELNNYLGDVGHPGKSGTPAQVDAIKRGLATLKESVAATPLSSCLNEARPYLLAAIDELSAVAGETTANNEKDKNVGLFIGQAENHRGLCYRSGESGIMID